MTHAAVAPRISFIFALVISFINSPMPAVNPTVIQIRVSVFLTWLSHKITSDGRSDATIVVNNTITYFDSFKNLELS
jgi:hypothetical protein